jgi:hypothetical protein
MSARAEKSIPSPEGTAVVLAVSPLPADRVRLRDILSREHRINWGMLDPEAGRQFRQYWFRY